MGLKAPELGDTWRRSVTRGQGVITENLTKTPRSREDAQSGPEGKKEFSDKAFLQSGGAG